METETLSSYEQPQDKHILDDGLNVNIPNHDEDSNSLHNNEINEAESDVPIEPVSSSCKKDTEENCDETVSSSENKIGNADNLENENEVNDTLSKSINSPNVSSSNYEEEEEKDHLSDEESTSKNEETKHDSPNNEHNESVENVSDTESSITKNDSEECKENADTTNSPKASEDKNESDDPLEPNKEDNNDGKSEVDSANEKNSEVVTEKDEENSPNTAELQEEKETATQEKESEKTPVDEAFPLLKETLTKQKEDGTEDKEAESETGNEEMDMDDDFDPSLLCPDIAMEVDEAPVITTTDNVPSDGNKSPLLYDPVYSTYVDEMTGAEVTFNLTPEEHQMRHDAYGDKNPIQFTKIHCTACNVHLGSALDGQGNRFVHPLLKVLICKDCYHFYTSGEFEKDEDGSELYCRWCGQGGQVMCCSSCEMVFCKKCIRINFGRKKLTEIRDSDDWYCFRCNPIQLTELRVHCAEFMEYVRREISRAATLENATSFMTTDYTQCCLAQKKKYVDPNANEQPKKKRKKWVDPDYDPQKDLVDSSKPNNLPPEGNLSPPTKIVPILPKTSDPNLNAGVVTQVSSPIMTGTVFKVGNTTFRPRGSPVTQVRPTMQTATSTGIRSSGPGYIKIMPSGVRATTARQPAQTFVSSSVRQQPFQQRQVRPAGVANPTMKHEWFEKTVRAAARVNSNLSYTLTQLNRAQASASSVEALAVVHNKLQEILSTSINSLIQIRKNLRTEFISGIKNIRFPPKPAQPRPQPSTSAQDDDVIFVSPTTSPVPPPLTVATPNSIAAASNLTPSVSLINSPATSKKSFLPIVPTTSLQLIPGTSSVTNSVEKPKVFLRVKSLSALQNVTSECITIPDDPVPPPPPLTAIRPSEGFTIGEVVTMVEDSPLKEKEDSKSEEMNGNETAHESEAKKDETEVSKAEDVNTKEMNGDDERSEEDSSFTVKDIYYSPDPKKLPKIKICLQRSEEIDELVKSKFGLVNGDASE